MKSLGKFRIVLVTAPDLKTARHLAHVSLAARLIACANLIPGVESHYRWQGEIQRGREVLLILKTIHTRIKALRQLILAHHPYTTPEFVELPITAGATDYLNWLSQNCVAATAGRGKVASRRRATRK